MAIPPVNIGGDFGKAVAKGIHELSRHFGRFTQPFLTHKNADADAYRQIKMAEAEAYTRQLLAHVDAEIAHLLPDETSKETEAVVSPEDSAPEDVKLLVARTLENTLHRDLHEQNNIDQITARALELLAQGDDTNVADKPVEPDWMSRYFDGARHISDQEVGEIWAHILAGEIQQPGSYSLRTMEALRNLSSSDAQVFVHLAGLVLEFEAMCMIFIDDERKPALPPGISYDELLSLDEAGLIVNESGTTVTLGGGIKLFIVYGNQLVGFIPPRNTTIPIYKLTRAGAELCKVTNPKFNDIYLYKFIAYLKKRGAKVFISQIQDRREGRLWLGTEHEVSEEETQMKLTGKKS